MTRIALHIFASTVDRRPVTLPRGLSSLLTILCITMLAIPVKAAVMYERQPDGTMRLVVVPDPPPKGKFACRALITFRGDPGEILMPANSAEEASKLSINRLGDGPIKCRELKEGEQIGDAKPPGNPLLGPFSRVTMGDYFNAIYNGEPDIVRALDRRYIGKIVDDIEGAYGNNAVWQKIVGALQIDKATLIEPAIKTYTQSYGNFYQKCLRKDAVPVTFTRTVSNSYGVVSSTDIEYQVNPEFVTALKGTTAGSGENGWDAIGDMGYGSPLARTESGIKEIMGSFRCDDPVIKRFEAQLLQMYTAHIAGRQPF